MNIPGALPLTPSSKLLYRWRSVSGPEFPRYPMSEELAQDIAKHIRCEIEKTEEYEVRVMTGGGGERDWCCRPECGGSRRA